MDNFYLDYTIDNYEERLKFIEENYNLENTNSRHLEYITDYLLASRDMKEFSKKDGIGFKSNNVLDKRPNEVMESVPNKGKLTVTVSGIGANGREDASYDMTSIEKYQVLMENRDVKRRAIRPKQKQLTQKDILSNEFLTSYQLSVLKLKELITKYEADFEKLSNQDKKYIYQLKKISREIKTEMKIVKTCFDKVIDFRNISESSGHNIAELINLKDPKHMYQLLRMYPDLKKQANRKIDSDLKFLLWETDEIINEYLTDFDIEVLEMLWDNKTLKQIADEKGFSSPARVFEKVKQMANICSKNYAINYSIWYHENVLEGKNMKQCPSCGKIKPNNELFFYRKTDSFSKKCIECTLGSYNKKIAKQD